MGKFAAAIVATLAASAINGCATAHRARGDDRTAHAADGDSPAQLIKARCCTRWSATGWCEMENVPGCSERWATAAPSPRDACCTHWTPDGRCARELIPRCSVED